MSLSLLFGLRSVEGPLATWEHVVRNVLREPLDRIRALHEQLVPDRICRAEVIMTVDPAGRVSDVRIVSSDADEPRLVAGIAEILHTVELPPLEGSAAGTVTFEVGMFVPPHNMVPG